MDWLKAVFSGDNSAITLVIIVVGLAFALVLLAWVFRKIAGDGSLKAGRNRQPRLSVTDAAIVDEKRRLVLVRRDNVEHLVMIGGPSDIVIEQNIARASHGHQTADHAPARAARQSAERVSAHQQPARAVRPVAQPAPEPEEEPGAIAEQAEEHTPQPQTARTSVMQQAAVEEAREAGSQAVELELTEADIEAEIAAGEQATEAARYEAAPTNGHAAAQQAPEIEIDLAELQMEIDRSQGSTQVRAETGNQGAKTKVAAPSLDASETVAQAMSRKNEQRPVRGEPKAAPEPAGHPTSRVKSMEDEMQRLLEELSGPARN